MRVSMRTRLFIAYSIALTAITLLIGIPLYHYLKSDLEQSLIDNVHQMANRSGANVDNLAASFNNITFQFYNSYDSKRTILVEHLRNLHFPYESRSQQLFEAQQSLLNFLMVTSSVHKEFSEVHIYTLTGQHFSKSFNQRAVVQQLEDIPFFPDADQAEGGVVLYSSSVQSHPGNEKSYPGIELVRKLIWFSADLGYMRLLAEPDTVFDSRQLEQWPGAILLIRQGDHVIYSSQGATKDQATGEAVEDPFGSSVSLHETGYTLEIIVPSRELFQPLRLLRNMMLLIILIILLLSVSFYYLLARILTQPIVALKKAMDATHLYDNGNLQLDNKYRMNEVESLKRSFQRMNSRLQEATRQRHHFETLQLRSHFQALQAQIHPHFLFNTLSVITVMAERSQAAAVADVSRQLSRLLRYSLDNREEITSLEEELATTDSYLQLMKFRYLDRLHFEINISKEMLTLKLPKLTLQPIAENSVQYGFHHRTEKLQIWITGNSEPTGWRIAVRDNGQGFSPAVLTQLNTRIEDYLYNLQQSQPLSVGGMGLISTAARLRLLFKDTVSFTVSNHPEGGALVTISGAWPASAG